MQNVRGRIATRRRVIPGARSGPEIGATLATRMRKRLALAVPLALLTGCAHTPLVTSCITPSQYQQLESQRPPKVHDKLTGEADKDVRPLAGSIIEHRAYEDVLLGTLKVCSTNTK